VSYLKNYQRVLKVCLSEKTSSRVIDFGAGTQWLKNFGFATYQALDIKAPSEIWDFDTPLPSKFSRSFDLAISLNSLHYARDPASTLREFFKALGAGGELVLAVPWLYPPHDRSIDSWRVSPRGLFRLLEPHFAKTEVFSLGTVFDLPWRVAGRYLHGGFQGLTAEQIHKLSTLGMRGILAQKLDDIPTSFFGPLTTVIHAREFR
jgi:SAM-dependent methyltransferase